ncbi:tetratricopeptide repeat protein [Streptomyces sp. SID3343]|uniref:tetratricopeptide repeat protein n=1 Tax=Streptomyces sp. SID3343 TaxID=2690260 RepID=UPI001370BF16|nr:tetratricopeptide repeat protein [Streptomyces sp. SID3343]MYW01296.1 tetratricopeptide repeat protein [Streptomyces sp. SID3343]
MTANERDAVLAEAIALREAGRAEEAREPLVRLVEQHPGDAQLAYQAAWVHDVLGLEREAVPFYEWALIGDGLPASDRLGAFVGLGSTYRALGAHDKAVTTLRRGLTEFPADPALTTFLAMALYNSGADAAKEAVESLLRVIATTTNDPRLTPYRPAITHYATNLDVTHD